MALTSMKLAPKAADKDMEATCCPSGEAPAYPYGLCLYLDNDTLAKLGIAELPDVGTKLVLSAIVEVTSNTQRQTQEGKNVAMDLQITDMDLEAPGKSAAQRLYGKA